MPQSTEQVRFCRSRDGTGIAFATCGSGPPLVWVQHWIHHLKFDWNNPVWQPWLSFLARRHTLIRYDWRGCGLSDRDKIDFSPEKFIDDVEAVVEAAGVERFALFGMSGAGSDAGYVLRHPDRVTKLVLLGTQAKARWAGNPTSEQVQEGEARLKVYELGWSNETPAYGQFFTALHIPDASTEYKAAYNGLLRQTTTAANAVGLLRAFYKLDLSAQLLKIRCPTLVLHARGDSVIPFEAGRKLAALIPGARFSLLESRNHVLLNTEPAWQSLTAELEDFLPAASTRRAASSLDELTAREQEVLEVLAQGLDNNGIAARLEISGKTARNHLSIIFGKLGVKSRAQAIVLARDAGFGRRGLP